MLPRDRGVIVQVGSTLAYRGIPLQAPYCAAKHAVQGFHDSLLAELLHDRSNVRVCMVNLPAVNTPQFRWIRNHMPRKPQTVRHRSSSPRSPRERSSGRRNIRAASSTSAGEPRRPSSPTPSLPELLDHYLGPHRIRPAAKRRSRAVITPRQSLRPRPRRRRRAWRVRRCGKDRQPATHRQHPSRRDRGGGCGYRRSGVVETTGAPASGRLIRRRPRAAGP